MVARATGTPGTWRALAPHAGSGLKQVRGGSGNQFLWFVNPLRGTISLQPSTPRK